MVSGFFFLSYLDSLGRNFNDFLLAISLSSLEFLSALYSNDNIGGLDGIICVSIVDLMLVCWLPPNFLILFLLLVMDLLFGVFLLAVWEFMLDFYKKLLFYS